MRAIWKTGASFLLASALVAEMCAPVSRAQVKKKEYLTETEADKIREAGESGPRIALFATFASDRIKKIKYELAHIDPADEKRAERMNALINGYAGCIDDAADLIEIGKQRQEDIRQGVKVLDARIKESLPFLQELAANGAERGTYKENLSDAIEATQDAAKDVEKVMKENTAPPVRRKPT
jgi:hypothetical protein